VNSRALKDHRTPAITETDAILRRCDLSARVALLAAGLCAQGAMWVVGYSRVYLVAAVVLIAVSAESARRPLIAFVQAAKGHPRQFSDRQINAARVVAGVVVVEACLIVVGWLDVAGVRSMATPLGVLLVAVQAAQAMAVESRRDLKLGCAVVVILLVQAGAFTSTSTVLLPMLLALLQRGSALAKVQAIARPGRAPLIRAWAGPVVAAAVIGLTVFLSIPNSLGLDVKAHLINFGGHSQASSTSADPSKAPAPGAGTRADPGAARLDLRVRGELSKDPVFVVDSSAPAYWQGSVFATFDGTAWTPISGSSSTPWLRDRDGVQNVPEGQLVLEGQPGARSTGSVRVVSAQAPDVVLAPGRAVAYQGSGQVFADPNGAARLRNGPSQGASYVVTFTQAGGTVAQLRAASGPDVSDPQWRALPADLPTRVRTLASDVTAGAPSRYDVVAAVEDYLRARETYDLDSPVPPAGQDAVDDFLFTTNRGFCEQFATAAVVMLRSVGVSARLVVGYAQGDTTSQPGARIMRGTDAHAWVQVWYGGLGWVDSDPTAGAVLAPRTATQPAQLTVQPTPLSQPTASAQPALVQPTPAVTHPKPNLPGGRAAWFAGVAIVGLLVFGSARLGGLLLRRRRRKPKAGWQPGDGPVLQAYLRLDRALAGMSRGRAPEETLREVGRRLGSVVATPVEVATTLQCLERECYGIDAPTHAQAVAAVEVLDRLRRAVGSQLMDGKREPARAR
jgi:transglutaminase-like putative cysteine protease